MIESGVGPLFELREYRLHAGTAQTYLRGFAERIVPRLRDCGFAIQGAWIEEVGEPDVTNFVWLLRWRDRDERARAFARLVAWDQWEDYKTEVAPMLVEALSRIMSPVALEAA